jgi:chemotaxis signal transduction protein
MRDLLETERGDQCRLARSASGAKWPCDERLKATPTAIGTKPWFCLFRGDAGPMAVSVESVAEVLETDTLVRLAWSPPQVVGLCSYHREVVPVVTLGSFPSGAGDDRSNGPDQAPATDSVGEKLGSDDRTRCVVLILKTEHGNWGIRVDPENTIMSPEFPQYDSPRTGADGPALIGTIGRAGTCYRILNAEAAWRALRSEVGRWAGLISGFNAPSPLPSADEQLAVGTGLQENTGSY